MIKAARIDISDIAYDDKCERKPYMAVLLRINNLEKYFQEKHWIFIGKFLHEILQSTFSYNYSLVEYFYYKKNLKVGEALLNTMNLLKQRYIELLNEENENYPWFENYSMQGDIKEALNTGIPILAKLSETLIDIMDNGMIISNVIGTEYKIDLQINNRYSLIGKIDILAWKENRKKIRVIELKTGRKSIRDKSQVLTYAEIIRKERKDLEVIPELWYVKQNKRCKIIYPELSDENKEIERIKNVITIAEQVKTEKDLPPMSENDFLCREFCRMCIQHIDTIFPKKIKKEQIKKKNIANLDRFFS